MKSADLFSIKPEVKDKKLVMVATFAEVARWTPKTLLTADVSIEVWMRFLEDCMVQLEIPDHVFTLGFFTLEVQKSQVKLIGEGTHAFTIRSSQWKKFLHEMIERLVMDGVIVFEDDKEGQQETQSGDQVGA